MHLIHPALVHFSVALLVLGGLGEAIGLLLGRETLRGYGEKLVLLGVISLVPTIFSGYVAANSLDVSGAAERVLDGHERNAWLVLGAFAAALFWKGWFRGAPPPAHRPFLALLLLAAVALTVWSAVLGGEMVYRHGVGVG